MHSFIQGEPIMKTKVGPGRPILVAKTGPSDRF